MRTVISSTPPQPFPGDSGDSVPEWIREARAAALATVTETGETQTGETQAADHELERLLRAEARAAEWRDRAARAETKALRQRRKILKLTTTGGKGGKGGKANKKRSREIRRRLERAAEWERRAGRAECKAARFERRAARIRARRS